MAVSKVIYGGTTLIDLTTDTVTADKLFQIGDERLDVVEIFVDFFDLILCRLVKRIYVAFVKNSAFPKSVADLNEIVNGFE